MPSTLLITILGAVPQRVLDCIYAKMPNRIILLHQRDAGWNENNPDYKKHVMDKFENDPLIRSFRKRGMIDDSYTVSMGDYDSVFKTVYNLLVNSSKNYEEIFVDVTGMTRIAVTAVNNAVATVKNAFVLYNETAKKAKYTRGRYGTWVDEKGKQLVLLPTPRVDIAILSDKSSYAYRVFKAAFEVWKNLSNKGVREKVFLTNSIVAKMKELGFITLLKEPSDKAARPKADIEKISITMNLNNLIEKGLIKETFIHTGRQKEVTFSPFGLSLARTLFEPSSPEGLQASDGAKLR